MTHCDISSDSELPALTFTAFPDNIFTDFKKAHLGIAAHPCEPLPRESRTPRVTIPCLVSYSITLLFERLCVVVRRTILQMRLFRRLTHFFSLPTPHLPDLVADSSALTKISRHEMALGSESIAYLTRRFSSKKRCPCTALFSPTCHPWSYRPLQFGGDNESRSRGSTVKRFLFELLFSFLRTIIGCSLGCVVFVLGALASDMNVGILWLRAVFRNFCSTWSGMKQPCTRRISAFALAALCIVGAPLCAKSQVGSCRTCDLRGFI